MSINSLKDWSAVELAAQNHELANVTTNKVPMPTQAQALLWATTDLANCRASLMRKNGSISEAIMYLSIGATDRAKEVLTRAFLDL